MASEYIRSMEGTSADCDSMVLISLCYGKQVAVSEARGKEESASADRLVGSAFSDEVMLNDVEQLKHLLPYDLGLAEKDCGYHSSLLVFFAQLKALKNMRIRSKESEDWRTSRVPSSDRRPPPPPAPVRPPVTPPKTPPSQQPRVKAAPSFLK